MHDQLLYFYLRWGIWVEPVMVHVVIVEPGMVHVVIVEPGMVHVVIVEPGMVHVVIVGKIVDINCLTNLNFWERKNCPITYYSNHNHF